MADILFYNELVTVLVLKNKELSQEDFPNLNTWFKKIGSIPEVMDSEKKLREIVNKYNFV